MRRRAAIAALALVIACKRPEDAAPDAGAAAVASITTPAPHDGRGENAEPAPASRPMPAPHEASRSKLARLTAHPLLAPHEAVLRRHFGASAPHLELQQAWLPGGGSALLLRGERPRTTLDAGADGHPLVLTLDAKGALLWSRDRPVAGVIPPVGDLAIAPGPQDRVLLAMHDPPTRIVAARIWGGDGSPFADFQLMTSDCEALSAFYWHDHGWVVVAARHEGSIAQLLTAGGRIAWGAGVPVGAPWRSAAPASMASAGRDGFVLVQLARVGDRGDDHIVALRYDAQGHAVWAAPLDLGTLQRVADPLVRLDLQRRGDDAFEVKLGGRTARFNAAGEVIGRY